MEVIYRHIHTDRLGRVCKKSVQLKRTPKVVRTVELSQHWLRKGLRRNYVV